MTTLEQAARLALEALLKAGLGRTIRVNQKAIDSAVGILRAALAQQAQQAEPVDKLTITEPKVYKEQAEPVVEAVDAVQDEPDGSAGWSIEAEREACAQLCADYTEWGREWAQDSNHTAAEAAANECADAIRARGWQAPARQAEPVVDDGPEYGIDEDTGRVK